MDESGCRDIFKQVVSTTHHLHTKSLVVHRDIKDKIAVLDEEWGINLIYLVVRRISRTAEYAAPEILQGELYRGKEQDIWALGILLYDCVWKNPFYTVDEILDHPCRIP
ncbi:uncharacterized protein N7473_004342 [Penicillium subrubescens]|uniref:Serine/threonine-protein kinase PSK2 n=1 Tax=Penicillium subrubescens TaxID=1316194 RepID=A0A1Q5TNA3_9EURO|nr:uncharacterized protein N7473_004342 [Penicillium subrubescens]KAJ5900272.1 hypothetical protein N7473_004342 [Penicillium subrubescens]OKP01713.1 Serine/threonine-protein kinase PSK2 [Penicillium subrubescens]